MSAHPAHRAGAEVPTAAQVRRTGRVITTFTWLLTGSVVAVSMSTAAPFIDAHSPGWGTGPVMAVSTDGCFILSLQSDSTLARYGVSGGRWPAVFRWVTGLATVWLNIGAAALAKDLVGVIVHLIPPLLLLLVAEAGPAYRRALAALTRRSETAVPVEPEWPDEDTAGPLYDPAPTLPTTSLTPAVTAALRGPERSVPALPAHPVVVPLGPVVAVTAHPAPTARVAVPTAQEEATRPPLAEGDSAPSGPAVAALVGIEVPTGVGPVGGNPQAVDTAPPTDDEDAAAKPDPTTERLSEEDAAAVIEECWRRGTSQRAAALKATRAPSYVGRVYKRLDAQHGRLTPAT
ncbi:hypothetical protein [Kitasatospora sp. DSM 101779]|uniref:hypothetical protein n=1 Tax=Kitasatospora sp. DSM 101779 TaxID=2853165 RepID=UPI0021D96882|nr:hypothetical protein [Kitasatospora sp. DSM 101779]